MILYVDTSALVPLLVREPSSGRCGEIWDDADAVTSVRLAYVEAVAAIAQAVRLHRISASTGAAGRAVLDELWSVVDIIEVDRTLMTSAADLSVAHGLRADDATHCAAAIAVNDDHLVAATGDRRLLAAWHAEGLATWNPKG